MGTQKEEETSILAGVWLKVTKGCFNRTCRHRRPLPRCLTRQSTSPPSWTGPVGHGKERSSHSGCCCHHPRHLMAVSEASAQDDSKTLYYSYHLGC